MTETARPPLREFFPFAAQRIALASLLLFAAAICVHSGATSGKFLSWDDEQYLTSNPRIQTLGWDNLSWFFRNPYFNSFTPLAFVSHAVDWWLWGSDPHGHHWHSLILHGLNTVALFWFGLFFLGHWRYGAPGASGDSRPSGAVQDSLLIGAASAALLFAVHPLRVESVAWISDRKDLLAAFFGLTSTLTYFRGTCDRRESPSWAWLTISVCLFALALLSKFLIVFLPLAFLFVEAIFLEPERWRQRKWRLLLWKTPFLLPAAVIGLLAAGAIGIDPLGVRAEQIPPLDRLAFPFVTPWFYLQKLLVPANLSPVYQVRISASSWIAAIPMLGITAVAWVLWRRNHRGVLGAWLIYLLLLSPTFLFLSPFIQHTADRHSYFSTMPLFLLAGGGVGLLWRRSIGQEIGALIRLSLSAVILLTAAWYSYLTIRQTRIWENSVALWAQVVTVSPDLPIGYLNLGNAVAAAGNPDDAITLYRRATALEKGYGPAWTNMGVIYQLQGKTDQAEDSFRRSIAFSPDYFEAYINLGEIEEGKRNPGEAEKLYRQAALRNPASPKPWTYLGALFLRKDQKDSSLASFRRALSIDPFSATAHYGVGLILEAEGDTSEARRHFETAFRFGRPEALKELGRRQ